MESLRRVNDTDEDEDEQEWEKQIGMRLICFEIVFSVINGVLKYKCPVVFLSCFKLHSSTYFPKKFAIDTTHSRKLVPAKVL